MSFVGKLQFAEGFQSAPSRRGAPEPLRHVAGLDVLAHGQAAKQANGLKCPHGYSGARKAVARQTGAIAFADRDRAGERPLESGEDIDEGRLAGAVRPDEPENFAAIEPNADLVNRYEPAKPDTHLLRGKVHWLTSGR